MEKTKLELKLNESVRVKLLRDKCYVGSNSYGPYYLYTILDGEVEKSFFAPAEIHEQIVALGLKSGSEFTLKKVAAQNGKKITGELVFEAIQQASPAAPNGNPDIFKELMRQSIEDAVEIAGAFHGIDVQKIGTAIFIARTKSNGF